MDCDSCLQVVKTVINVVENPDKIFLTDECGTNAMEQLFKTDGIKIVRTFGCSPEIKDTQEFCFNDDEVVKGKGDLSFGG